MVGVDHSILGKNALPPPRARVVVRVTERGSLTTWTTVPATGVASHTRGAKVAHVEGFAASGNRDHVIDGRRDDGASGSPNATEVLVAGEDT